MRKRVASVGAGRRRVRTLVGLELFTAVTAVIGGLLLVVRPDGSLMSAKLSALSGTPFDDWRVPGVILALLVGGGGLVSAAWVVRRGRHARELSGCFGLGVILFELVELVWIGFQPLQVVFAGVGAAIVLLARSLPPAIDAG